MLVIATAAATGWLIERGEREAIGEAELRMQRFAAGAEAALNRTIIGVDLLLADMGELIAPDGRFERAAAERRLEASEHRDLTYRDLIVLDNEGNVVASATVGPDPITLRSSPTTSDTARVRHKAAVAAASQPPLIADRCLRTVLSA